MAPRGLVDPLDDFLERLMLEVDVDIGRLLALARHEALEEQLVPDRIDRGHAEQEADAAVRRRTAPLAQDPAAPALGNDRIDGQEIGRVTELADEAELMIDLFPVGRRHAARKHAEDRESTRLNS